MDLVLDCTFIYLVNFQILNVIFINPTFVVVPSPPLNVKAQDVTSNSVVITWEPPQSPNGRLLGYEVISTPNGGSLSIYGVENNSACKLTGMKSNTMYSISVRAKTPAGFGVKSIPVTFSTPQSGMFIYGLQYVSSITSN